VQPLNGSLGRIGVIAANTLAETVRQRLVLVFGLLGIGLIAGALALREFNFGAAELKFLLDFGFGALSFFGTLVAVVATAQTFFGEIDGKTAQAALARPVTRVEFIVGKLGGVAALLGVFALAVTVSLVLVLGWREHAVLAAEGGGSGHLVPFGSVVAFCALQWLRLCLVAAMTLAVASYASSALFAVCVGFVMTVICHLQHLMREPGVLADGGVGRVALAALGFVFPNFQLFNLGDLVVADDGLGVGLMLGVAVYGALYIAVYAALAAYCFSKRDL